MINVLEMVIVNEMARRGLAGPRLCFESVPPTPHTNTRGVGFGNTRGVGFGRNTLEADPTPSVLHLPECMNQMVLESVPAVAGPHGGLRGTHWLEVSSVA